MVSGTFVASVAAFAAVANAWLPNDGSKPVLDKRGLSLFDGQPRQVYDAAEKRWLSDKTPIRGVNLGSLFIFEPWIDWQEWQTMGCSGQQSEFDCVLNTGQDRSDTAFQKHYGSYINSDDLDEMVSYGLNTIRVPLGYWLNEDLIEDGAHFPRGGLSYLTQLCGWASDRGLYIILDLHGAPGAQEPNQPFTGQYASTAGFYNDYNYDRAVQWLEWITDIIHTKTEYRNVGMLELVNEPLSWNNAVDSMRSTYYKNGYDAIRKVETNLGVDSGNRLHVQMMNTAWGSGNPKEFLTDTSFTAFDDHRYIKWDTSVAVDKDTYIKTSCADNRGADENTIVGEWSIAVPDDVEKSDEWSTTTQKDFYTKWFSAQVHAYEKSTLGWVFWTWKANLGDDYRWSYKGAVEAGVIPKNLASLPSVC